MTTPNDKTFQSILMTCPQCLTQTSIRNVGDFTTGTMTVRALKLKIIRCPHIPAELQLHYEDRPGT